MSGCRDALGPVPVGRRLGIGGEGEVFAVADGTSRALKVYAKPDAAREAKVRSMIAAGLAAACPDVAFPTAAVHDADGRFVGFTMRLVEGGQPIHELYSPGSRRRVFAEADWRFLVRVATNAARAFARVHAAGAVIGDVNGSGILVSRRAVAFLIDADSFQWGASHPCRVGVPEYTPGELQGGSLDGVERTVDHDAFGLAVLIFHLLFLGRHPFAGRTDRRDVELTDAVRQHLFAYSRLRNLPLRPPPGTLLLSDLPLGLATLFERAFAGVAPRPVPEEWVSELERLELGLSTCGANASHLRPTTGGCPWCRIERASGRPVFAPAGAKDPSPREHAAIANPSQVAAARLLARARAVGGEGARPTTPPPPDKPSERAMAIIARLARGTTSSADATERKTMVGAFRKTRREMEAAIDDWRSRIGAWGLSRSMAEIEGELDGQAESRRRHHRRLLQIEDRLRSEMVEAALRTHVIDTARITGIGRIGAAKLAESGITTAADLDRLLLDRIPRFGEQSRLMLLLWRDGLAAEIGRNIAPERDRVAAAAEQVREARERETAAERSRLKQLVARGEAALRSTAARAALPDVRVAEAVGAFEQASLDLRHLGWSEQAPAPVPRPPPASAPNPSTRAPGGCPLCGGQMVRRWARGGSAPNRYFLGCASYPSCSGSRALRRRG